MVLFVGVGIIWIRSFWVCDTFECNTEKSDWLICVDSGRLFAMSYTAPEVRSYPFSWQSIDRTPPPPQQVGWGTSGSVYVTPYTTLEGGSLTITNDLHHSFPGLSFSRNSQRPFQGVAILISFWPLSATTGILPLARLLLFLRTRSRRRRLSRGLCVTCGYDLRATPYLCPECGVAAA